MRGHDDGLLRFCTPANGYRAGIAGRSIAVTCPANLSATFDDAYRYGHRIHLAEKELHSHDRALKAKRTELDELGAQIASVEEQLVGAGDRDRHQAPRMKKMRVLIRREAELEREIAALERERDGPRDGGRAGRGHGPAEERPGKGAGRSGGQDGNKGGNRGGHGNGRGPDDTHARGPGQGNGQGNGPGRGRGEGHAQGRGPDGDNDRGKGNGQAVGQKREGNKHGGGRAAENVLTGSAQGHGPVAAGREGNRILKQRYEQMMSRQVGARAQGAGPERDGHGAEGRPSPGHGSPARHRDSILLQKKYRELEQVRRSIAVLEREMDQQSASRHERMELLRQSKRLSREERHLEADIYEMEREGELLRERIHRLRARSPY
jgi:hypothetical protein